MSIRIENKLVVYESVTMEAFNPEYNRIKAEKIREYLKEHPMPDDPEYNSDDLIYDLTESSGMYTLPLAVKESTIDYVADLLNALF